MREAEISDIFDRATEPLRDLVRVQDAYDAVGWRVSSPHTAKFRHMLLHLMDTTAQLARIAERNDHREDDGNPVSDEELGAALNERGLLIAELSFTLLQLASLGDVDLAAALHDLFTRNARHFAPESEFARLRPRRYDERLVR